MATSGNDDVDYISKQLESATVSENHVDYVDFSEEEEPAPIIGENIRSLYERNGKKTMFDDKTMDYYKTLRERKMDPILLEEVDDKIAFKFHEQWNPYTGALLDKDPYGPLYFHPDSLIRYYYVNRLNDLWISEIDQADGMYQGNYDVAVGAGNDIYIESRGYNPERYLFRLPIIDCYCTPETENTPLITMGPVLSDSDVKKIDELASKCGSNYSVKYGGAIRPSLVSIKQLYDMAVSKKPKIFIQHGSTQSDINSLYETANRLAVDKLKRLKG